MTVPVIPTAALSLALGVDRTLAWAEGGSVRYLVADLSATGAASTRAEAPPLNLALAIDISGSMSGEKLAAAGATAAAVARALTPRDRLTIVTFGSTAEVLFDTRPMDGLGLSEALSAISRLRTRGNTNLWEGWLLAAERVAVAMSADAKASHRILLLSDGQANAGVIDRGELAHHAGELLERGIITSAVGIGDGYDENLLGGMTEAGGGRLHDAERPHEIGEVVLGELLEGQAALLERTTLRIAVPANLRAEVVGAWSHTVLPGSIEVLVGMLLPDRLKRVVLRLHCSAGTEGTTMVLGATAEGALPNGSAQVSAEPAAVEIRLATGRDNSAQERNIDRSVAALTAWQADVMRRAVGLNREGNRRGARHFLERELRWMESYARGLKGIDTLLAEVVLLLRRIDEELDPRLSKDVFRVAQQRTRFEQDLRVEQPASLSEVLRREHRR